VLVLAAFEGAFLLFPKDASAFNLGVTLLDLLAVLLLLNTLCLLLLGLVCFTFLGDLAEN
jgi:hypothetical protein